jgi:invasion protein IalB
MRRALMLCSLIAPYLIFGGSALEAASDPRATQLTYGPWSKICIGSSNCFVGAGARGACYPSGGGLSIIVTDDKNASLSANLGTKRRLEGAISVQVDQGDPILIPHPECHALGCGGKIEIDNALIERLKRSQTITIAATNTAHQKIRLSLSLADFAKAYDGAGTEPKVSEEIVTSDEMKESMKRGEKEKLPRCEE